MKHIATQILAALLLNATLAIPITSAGQTSSRLANLDCLPRIKDKANPGNCIRASSNPELGTLYPLGTEFNVGPTGRIGVGSITPSATLDLRGGLDNPLTGTVSVTASSTAVEGTGTNFDPECVVGGSIRIGEETFVVSDIIDDTHLTIGSPHTTGASASIAYSDPVLLSIKDSQNNELVRLQPEGTIYFKPVDTPRTIWTDFENNDASYLGMEGKAPIVLVNRSITDQSYNAIEFRGFGNQFASAIVCRKEGPQSQTSIRHGLSFFTTASGNSGTAERMRISSSGNVGIGTVAPAEKLHVMGNICATGSIGSCSDERYKKSIAGLEGALEKLRSLRGVSYRWKHEEFPDLSFSDKPQIGFLAQEVEAVVPEVVSQGADGFYSVDYGKLTVLLTEAVKEQDEQFNSISRENAALHHEVEALELRLRRLEELLESQAVDK